MLVDLFGDAADDMLGWVDEALSVTGEAQQAARAPVDLQRGRQALATSQERFNRITYYFSFDLLRYERIAELIRFGRTRGGEWGAWAASVKDALEGCQQPVFDVSEALFGCWQELTEHASAGSVTMRATTIGQHFALPQGQGTAREETT